MSMNRITHSHMITFFVLDFNLDIVNGVRGFHLERNGLASKSLDENLHIERMKTKRKFSDRGALF